MTRLEVDNLTKSYGTLRALDGVSFTVEAGEVFGFVGSNGAGKTTTMRIALGVLEPDSGQVRWQGEPFTLQSRRRVGYMPEERGLYPKMRVGEQLIYLARLHGMSPSDARTATELWTERLGIAARRNDEVQKLSLGNQQRVQLAAALVHNPEVLVLDEPFSGLDPVAVDVMSRVLQERSAAGVPVIFSSHQLELVERTCDRVGIIQDGKMVAVGTVNELRQGSTTNWRINAPDAPTAWATKLPQVATVLADNGRGIVDVELTDNSPGTEQPVLQAALQTGPVTEFTQIRPSLTDLYRDVVSTPASDEPDLQDKDRNSKQKSEKN